MPVYGRCEWVRARVEAGIAVLAARDSGPWFPVAAVTFAGFIGL
jgi:hypothetical protein